MKASLTVLVAGFMTIAFALGCGDTRAPTPDNRLEPKPSILANSINGACGKDEIPTFVETLVIPNYRTAILVGCSYNLSVRPYRWVEVPAE